MTKNQRIEAFVNLGKLFTCPNEINEHFLNRVYHQNPWFTPENTLFRLNQISSWLTESSLSNWIEGYPAEDSEKTVGLIIHENIPLASFHDLLCCLILGFNVQIKISNKDAGLTRFIIEKLYEVAPEFQHKIKNVDFLKKTDLIIAAPNKTSIEHFKYYFGKKPHLLRRRKHSAAILNGKENQEDLKKLGENIFTYFGLSSSSVSKVYVPADYDFKLFFEAVKDWAYLIDHFKYKNNYEYRKSVYLLNRDKHYDNGFLLVKPDFQIASPLAVLHYAQYKDIHTLFGELEKHKNLEYLFACDKETLPLVNKSHFKSNPRPSLEDYGDDINTLEFLTNNR